MGDRRVEQARVAQDPTLLSQVVELEKALRDLREAQRVAHVGSWEYLFETDTLIWSEEVHHIFGTDPATFVPTARAVRDLVHADDRRRFVAARRRAFVDKLPFDVDHRIVRPDGSVRHLHQLAEIRFDSTGRPLAIAGTVQDVTERILARERLDDSEALLAIAGRLARVGGWSLDLEKREITWTQTAAEIQEAGDRRTVSPEEAATFYAPEDRDRIRGLVSACAVDGTPFDEEFQLLTASGQRVWVRSIGHALRDGSGRIVRVHGAFQDISAAREAANRLERTSRHLASVLESLSDGFFTIDARGRFTYLNRSCEALLRRRREDLLGKRLADEFADTPDGTFLTNYLRAWNAHEVVEFEILYPPLDRWFELRVHPTGDELAVSIRDVTERHEEREALRQSIERFRNVARATSDAIWEWNMENDEVWWGEGMNELFGYAADEIASDLEWWIAHVHEDDQDRIVRTMHRVIDGGESEWNEEYRFACRDGSWAWVLDRAFVVRNDEGTPVRVVGSMTDLTTRRNSEMELARLNRALLMRSGCSQALIRATSEQDLLTSICRIAVKIGGYGMAWVGYAEDDADRTIRPVAFAGAEDGYLSEVKLSWSESQPHGRGPAGQAVRSGTPSVLEDALNSPTFTWSDAARRRGFRGVVCLPLRVAGRPFGLIGLYTTEVRPIGAEEIGLLQALADDLAFGIVSLRSRVEHRRMQDAVARMAVEVSTTTGEDFFLQLVRSMTEALGADAGFVARFLPGEPLRSRTVAAVVDGHRVQNAEYLVHDTPCRLLLDSVEAQVAGGLEPRFPHLPDFVGRGAQAWIGRRIEGPDGKIVGVVVALFRRAPGDMEFARSTLRIFTARATAELERSRLARLEGEQRLILERIAAGAPVDEVAEAVIRLIEAEVPGAVSGVFLVDDTGKNLILRRAPSMPGDLRDALASVAVAPGAGTCGAAAFGGVPVAVGNLAPSSPPTGDPDDLAATHGFRASCAVPFFAADRRVQGTFSLHLRDARTPTAEEIDLVATTTHLLGIAVARERAETALRSSEAMVGSTFAAAAAGIAITRIRDDRRFTLVNRSFCTMLGYTEEELQGLDFLDITHPEDREESMVWNRNLLAGRVERFDLEKRYIHKQGHVVWARISVSMIPPADGLGVSVIAVCQDITALKVAEEARRTLEEQLREAQKMEAVGTLAGGIAHDFNNILGAILGNVELARMDAGDNAGVSQSLDEIWRASLRAKELTRQILAFSRRDHAEFEPMALLPVLEESVRLLRATMPTRASIELECDDGLPAVIADPVQIEQVLLNLGTNAVHAMAGLAGSIVFRADVARPDEDVFTRFPGMSRALHVRVSVIDQGHGMDDATLQRIFEPFFTTKPVGEGTGLGLPVVHGILKAHRGGILARSDAGRGSSFEIYLPMADGAAVAPLPPKTRTMASPRGGKGRRILYIDDDGALLTLVQRLLGRQGYEVTPFEDPKAALAELRAQPQRFDLVLSDFNMPRFSGLDVARAVREISPGTPMAITSGYITDELRSEGQEAGVRAILFKPDFVDELCDAVRDLVEEVRRTS